MSKVPLCMYLPLSADPNCLQTPPTLPRLLRDRVTLATIIQGLLEIKDTHRRRVLR